jgi:hypothetical protein
MHLRMKAGTPRGGAGWEPAIDFTLIDPKWLRRELEVRGFT